MSKTPGGPYKLNRFQRAILKANVLRLMDENGIERETIEKAFEGNYGLTDNVLRGQRVGWTQEMFAKLTKALNASLSDLFSEVSLVERFAASEYRVPLSRREQYILSKFLAKSVQTWGTLKTKLGVTFTNAKELKMLFLGTEEYPQKEVLLLIADAMDRTLEQLFDDKILGPNQPAYSFLNEFPFLIKDGDHVILRPVVENPPLSEEFVLAFNELLRREGFSVEVIDNLLAKLERIKKKDLLQ